MAATTTHSTHLPTRLRTRLRNCSIGLALSCLAFAPLQAQAAGNQSITNAGDILRLALPAAAAGISLYKGDYQGLAQFGVAYIGTMGMAEGLKQFVHERRPDGSDWKSFPSASAASAQAASAYLWHRYGWKYGLPAFGLALFTGYSRVQAKKHHWYDVAASDVIAFSINYLVVTRYHKPYSRYHLSMGASPDGVSLQFAMNL